MIRREGVAGNSGSHDSPATSSGSEKDSPERPGARASLAHPFQTDELTKDLIGSMKRLSRDELRYKKIAKKLF